jgi:hypothetical protein
MQFEPGEEVIITTSGGEKHGITVTALTKETISGRDSSYLISNILQVEKSGIDPFLTAVAAPPIAFLSLIALAGISVAILMLPIVLRGIVG